MGRSIKVTVWIKGSGQAMEFATTDPETIDWWDNTLEALAGGYDVDEFLHVFDEETNISHYIRTDLIDVIKVEW